MPPDALHTEPLVIFVGAGASAIAPSSLPGWIDFNSVLLESLGEQVAAYSRQRQPVDVMLTALKARRDQTAFLPPDFQAQLMEEEVGADYFRVWQSIDTDVFGPVHAGIAELAATGRVAAIITTNFDRLIEAALQARGVAFAVHHDAAAFDSLTTAGVASACIPVLKIHGSIEDAASLVDTFVSASPGGPRHSRRCCAHYWCSTTGCSLASAAPTSVTTRTIWAYSTQPTMRAASHSSRARAARCSRA